MPVFRLNKLVRDKLPVVYESIGQKAKLKILSKNEHAYALIDKIIEEARELQDTGLTRDEIIGEIADVQQALDDYRAVQGITDEEIAATQKAKFDEKGGFSEGAYIETLELSEADTWIAYYRQKPDIYPEIQNKK